MHPSEEFLSCKDTSLQYILDSFCCYFVFSTLSTQFTWNWFLSMWWDRCQVSFFWTQILNCPWVIYWECPVLSHCIEYQVCFIFVDICVHLVTDCVVILCMYLALCQYHTARSLNGLYFISWLPIKPSFLQQCISNCWFFAYILFYESGNLRTHMHLHTHMHRHTGIQIQTHIELEILSLFLFECYSISRVTYEKSVLWIFAFSTQWIWLIAQILRLFKCHSW